MSVLNTQRNATAQKQRHHQPYNIADLNSEKSLLLLCCMGPTRVEKGVSVAPNHNVHPGYLSHQLVHCEASMPQGYDDFHSGVTEPIHFLLY